MKRKIPVFLFLILVLVGCKGYSGKSNPQSPEEKQVAALAIELSQQADDLNQNPPASLTKPVGEFTEAATTFNNACQRFGSNSLKARDAYDRLRYHASVLDQSITPETNPALLDQWQKIQTAYIKRIGKLLGYRFDN